MNSITLNADQNRFELQIDSSIAFIDFVERGNTLIFTHTSVPETLRGKGIAQALVQHAFDFARLNDRKIDSQCSYVTKYLDTHPEYADLKEKKRDL